MIRAVSPIPKSGTPAEGGRQYRSAAAGLVWCPVRRADSGGLRGAACFGDWLQEHLAAEATHHPFPALVHPFRYRPEVSPRWRCRQLSTVGTGERIRGLLGVLPGAFDTIPETLDTASKKDIVGCIGHAVTVRAWVEGTAAAVVEGSRR